MVKIARYYKVDGVDTYIMSEEAGSAAEALAEITEAAEELGAAPLASATAISSSATAGKGRAGSPKKGATATPPPSPPLPPGARGAFADTPPPLPSSVTKPVPGSALAAPAAAVPPEPSVGATDAPPALPGPPSVGLVPQPPPYAPPVSPEAAAHFELTTAISGLHASVPASWGGAITQAVSEILGRNGWSEGMNITSLPLDQTQSALKAVREYQARCDAAPR